MIIYTNWKFLDLLRVQQNQEVGTYPKSLKNKLNRCCKAQIICIPKLFTPTLLALNLHIISILPLTWLSHF